MTKHIATDQAQARSHGVDFLRAACILYIVGYWHLIPYTKPQLPFANWLTEGLTYVALGTFVFCSGYLLGRHRTELKPADLWSFYRRRLIRIYPLYAAAVLVFLLVGLASTTQAVDGLLLVSMFNPPALPTLWFVTMIMAFYLITPIIVRFGDSPRIALAVAGAIFAGLIGVHLSIQPIDPRPVLYFPAFVLGLLYRRVPQIGIFVERYKWWLLALSAVLLRFSWLGNIWSLQGALLAIPLTLASTATLFAFSDRIASKLHTPTVAFLAYASFGLYLFHRPTFMSAIAIYFPESGWAQVGYLVLVALPVAILIGYLIQRAYDRLLTRWGLAGA
jgi:peptidoglycan/LPS O-acetylase OafA/YrhL